MHFQHCRSCTAACIAIGSALQMPILVSALLVSTTIFVVPRRWLWFPALKRPAACMADGESALPTPDAKQRRGASPATLQEDCEFLAAALTESANTKTSSVAASTKGLDFYVVLKYINATRIEGRRDHMCNFQWEAHCEDKRVMTFKLPLRSDKLEFDTIRNGVVDDSGLTTC